MTPGLICHDLRVFSGWNVPLNLSCSVGKVFPLLFNLLSLPPEPRGVRSLALLPQHASSLLRLEDLTGQASLLTLLCCHPLQDLPVSLCSQI